MKYNKMLALALVSTSQIAIADRIENQFSTNETLTATRMNEIRSAVNGNDADIANKQGNIGPGCDSTEAIQDIDSDGTVTCTDIPQGGTGGGATTDYYYISGIDLRPVESTAQILSGNIQWNAYDLHGYGFPVTGGQKEVGHGVRLPDDATITDMRCYYYDNDPSFAITKFDFNLYERAFDDRKFGRNLLENNTSDDKNTNGQSPSQVVRESIARSLQRTRPLNIKVDNSKNSYHMRLRLDVSSSYTSATSNSVNDDGSLDTRDISSAIRTYGCRITYTR